MASEPEHADIWDSLDADVTCDVCVVGGGATGLLTAWELLARGLDVVVLEQAQLVGKVTGFTTAKLTSQHGLKYSAIESRFGLEPARWYGAANERALARTFELADKLDIDGDLERRDAYVYANRADTVDTIRAEADAAARCGLPASFVDAVPLPFETFGAVRFTAQAQYHPRRYLLAVAGALAERGVRIFEDTTATELSGNGPLRVQAETGFAVTATHVVQATLTPALVGRRLYGNTYCHQGYAVAVPVEVDPMPDGVFINADRPMRSLRSIAARADGSERLLQVGGSAYVADPSNGQSPWDELEGWAQANFPGAGPAAWRWSTQDYSSTDALPIIGREQAGRNVFIAHAFGGWGLTTAGVAAELIAAQVCGEHEAWHDMFSPARELPKVDTRTISAHRSGLPIDGEAALAALAPGRALVVDVGGEEVAAYREPDGTLHRVSAVCTHQGCIVLWDDDQVGWSCPCHGSTFAPDGTCTRGPAKAPLPAR